MKLGYSFNPENEAFVAKAQGTELTIKFKHATEICAAIQGMKAKEAEAYLQKVIDGKALIPFKKCKLHGGHKKGEGLKKWPYGKQPVKAVGEIIKVLKAAISNAEFRGLDADNCVVASAVAQRGRKMHRLRPKGRHAVYSTHLTTIQIVLEEVST